MGWMSRMAAAAACTALAACAGGTPEPSGELASWDQTRVTQYAVELAESTEALSDAADKLSPTQFVAKQRAFYQARDNVRMLHNASHGLADALRAGEGREATYPRYLRIKSLRQQAADEGAKADIPSDVLGLAEPVRSALMKLRPYYEGQ